MWMTLNCREVPKDKSQIVAEKFSHLSDYGKGASAVDTFEIPVLEKSNGCGFRSRDMVLFGYRVFESDYFFRAHNEPAINWKAPRTGPTFMTDQENAGA